MKGRPQFGYFIFDFPSDHEIDGALTTESDTIRSIIANNSLGGRLKIIRCTTASSFRDARTREYPGVRFVHLGGHGSPNGLAFIGGRVSWLEVAEKLKTYFPKIENQNRRVLTLSCCFSSRGVEAMKKSLKGHFSAIYYFSAEKIEFSKALTTWTMFYLKKELSSPHRAIMKNINRFLGEKVVSYVKL